MAARKTTTRKPATKRAYNRRTKVDQTPVNDASQDPILASEFPSAESTPVDPKEYMLKTLGKLTTIDLRDNNFQERLALFTMLDELGYRVYGQMKHLSSDSDYLNIVGIRLNNVNKLVTFISSADIDEDSAVSSMTCNISAQFGFSDPAPLNPNTIVVNGEVYARVKKEPQPCTDGNMPGPKAARTACTPW